MSETGMTLEQQVGVATEAVRVATVELQTALGELTAGEARADKRIVTGRLTLALEQLGAAQAVLQAALAAT